MVDCVVKDWDGASVGQATLDLQVAKDKTAAHVVHRALVRQLANQRQGTVSTKTRAEVRGKRARAVLGPVRFDRRCGVGVGSFLDPSLAITASR
jgi:hypothetical protein